LLNVQAAVTSTFAVAPTALSFLTGGANPNLSKTLTISNVGASAESYSLAVAPRDTGAAAPTLGVSTLTIQPGQSARVPVNFTASNLAAGPYEGFVTIRGSQSGILERAPYWYAVPSTTPANIAVLYVKGISDFDPSQSNYPYKAGQRINDAIYFRVTDASGLVIPDAQSTVTATTGGGAVISTVSRDSLWPGMFSVTVRLGPKAGTNVFRIAVGALAPFDISIEGK
jgi:hypothetical protein